MYFTSLNRSVLSIRTFAISMKNKFSFCSDLRADRGCNDCLGSLVYWHLCSGLLIRFGRIQIFKSCSNHKVTKFFERSQINMVESVTFPKVVYSTTSGHRRSISSFSLLIYSPPFRLFHRELSGFLLSAAAR